MLTSTEPQKTLLVRRQRRAGFTRPAATLARFVQLETLTNHIDQLVRLELGEKLSQPTFFTIASLKLPDSDVCSTT